MKKTISLLLAGLLLFSAAAMAEEVTYPLLTGEEGLYRAGTYEQKVRGMGGWMVVHVTFSADKLEEVEIVSHTETPNIGTVAIERVIPAIIEAQSIEVDGVTGATITSDALKKAVSAAIAEAQITKAEVGEALYVPGVYHERVRGMGGWMEIDFTFSAEKLENIEIQSHTETPNIGTVAIDRVLPAMLDAQTAEVDSVTGATITSEALKKAATAAFKEAAAQ